MKIKEVCERTGLTRRAVRFYEEKGLISPEIREENEYRDYTETDVCRLQLVARLRGYRFSVEEIRRLLERPQETEAVFDRTGRSLPTSRRKARQSLSRWNGCGSRIPARRRRCMKRCAGRKTRERRCRRAIWNPTSDASTS